MRFLPAVIALALALALASAAHADRQSDWLDKVDWAGATHKVHVALVGADTKLDEADPLRAQGYVAWGDPVLPIVAFSADGSVGWFAANLYEGATCPEGCADLLRKAKSDAAHAPPLHVTALVDGDQVAFVHFGNTGDGVGHGDAIDEQITDGAKPVVALFQKTIGDAKAFAATVSPRKDVLMYGTQPGERFVGGAAVRATLAKWGLSFKTAGAVVAGVAKTKTIAWVLADVDAAGKAGKRVPYRVSVVYEKTGDDWKIVQLQFT